MGWSRELKWCRDERVIRRAEVVDMVERDKSFSRIPAFVDDTIRNEKLEWTYTIWRYAERRLTKPVLVLYRV